MPFAGRRRGRKAEMARYVKDATRRFPERPHYEPAELDRKCERLITTFLRAQHGEIRFPIDTEDLKKLIERDTSDLDCYADLSGHGPDVEGLTEFLPKRRPAVKISAKLTDDDRRENRLRTTLTHEYTHVRFARLSVPDGAKPARPLRCRRHHPHHVQTRRRPLALPQTDWMEWQAGYGCGALLMPVSYVRRAVEAALTGVAVENAEGAKRPVPIAGDILYQAAEKPDS